MLAVVRVVVIQLHLDFDMLKNTYLLMSKVQNGNFDYNKCGKVMMALKIGNGLK